MLYYPNLNKPFDMYTNASDYQMGAAIIQVAIPLHIGVKNSPIHKSITMQQKKSCWQLSCARKNITTFFMVGFLMFVRITRI